jgi:hypothetical protein
MAATTSTGSSPTTTKIVSSGTSLSVPVNTSASLLQTASVSITGSGTTVLFLGRVSTTNDPFFQVDISIDGVSIYNDQGGQQIIARAPLTTGAHTVTFTGYALNQNITVNKFGLTVIDLGL